MNSLLEALWDNEKKWRGLKSLSLYTFRAGQEDEKLKELLENVIIADMEYGDAIESAIEYVEWKECKE